MQFFQYQLIVIFGIRFIRISFLHRYYQLISPLFSRWYLKFGAAVILSVHVMQWWYYSRKMQKTNCGVKFCEFESNAAARHYYGIIIFFEGKHYYGIIANPNFCFWGRLNTSHSSYACFEKSAYWWITSSLYFWAFSGVLLLEAYYGIICGLAKFRDKYNASVGIVEKW